MQSIQRLPRSEESALLELVRANDLDASLLACYMTRQQGHGRGTVPNGNFVRAYNISYDLMLCQDCGSAFQLNVCPAKARTLKERLNELNSTPDPQNLIDTTL